MRTAYTTDTIFSSSTRIRTWNISLEARHDVRFTIEPCQSINTKRKAWDSNPHAAQSDSALAVRPGEPYPATFHLFQWTHWESNRDSQPAELVSSHLTMSPLSGASGNRTPIAWLQTRRLPVGPTPQQFFQEVRPRIEPGPRPYHGRARPQHLQTLSDAGWSRTFTRNTACRPVEDRRCLGWKSSPQARK